MKRSVLVPGISMPLKIVDSNYLGDADLLHYLKASRSNKVVICDNIAREMHKHQPIKTAQRSTIYLKDYPERVSILRDCYYFMAQKVKTAYGARALIDREETKFFAFYCSELHQDPVPQRFVDHMALVQARATDRIERLSEVSADLESRFASLADTFTADELKILYHRHPFTESIQRKLLKEIDVNTVDLIKGMVPDKRKWPNTIHEAKNTFAYRYAMCMVLLYCRWVHFGRQQATSVKRVLNDVLDMQTAGVATFYGGLLSKDQKMQGVFREARFLLRKIGAYVG